MSAFAILAELNDCLESAALVADNLEREVENSLPRRRILKEGSRGSVRGGVTHQRSAGERMLGARQESFSVGPGQNETPPRAFPRPHLHPFFDFTCVLYLHSVGLVLLSPTFNPPSCYHWNDLPPLFESKRHPCL
jgi:hypothetical protein